MSVFGYDPVTRLQNYELDMNTIIRAKPRTIVYWPDNTNYWIIQGNTYPVKDKLSVIKGSIWDNINKEWKIPYTEENRLKLEEIRLSQQLNIANLK